MKLKGVFGFIGVGGPAFGDPGFHLQRLWVLPRQFVGDLIQNAAVRVKATGRRIEVGVRLLLQINQRTAFDGRICCPGCGCRQNQRRQQRQTKWGLHGEFLCYLLVSVGFIIGRGGKQGNKGIKIRIAGKWL